MTMPRWFEGSLLEAEKAHRPVDFSHLGEQFGLRIEEVLRPSALKPWQELAGQWKDPSGEASADVLSFLEKECPECMNKIPAENRPDFLSGLWKKRS